MENKIKETENGIVVTPDQASIEVVASYVEEMLEKSEVAMRDSYKINIALDELYSNIVRYSGASEAKVSCVVDEHTRIENKSLILASLHDSSLRRNQLIGFFPVLCPPLSIAQPLVGPCGTNRRAV